MIEKLIIKFLRMNNSTQKLFEDLSTILPQILKSKKLLHLYIGGLMYKKITEKLVWEDDMTEKDISKYISDNDDVSQIAQLHVSGFFPDKKDVIVIGFNYKVMPSCHVNAIKKDFPILMQGAYAKEMKEYFDASLDNDDARSISFSQIKKTVDKIVEKRTL